ncbi:Putative membrane-associated trancriptional regulator [Halorhabdus sp. SVX81]|uniref:helix-turn-helix transcriptional regulator n=1 Tax=Halorhabdus sp. SVX81 TaxID=2978283 RepID=UPI0023DB24A3|nr:hypothetical protein [Halorhabdus sp. SVX81]WEL18339.1 Putative membrane-associated trancriptional regulator [Halorhabdus sp. SVX81]
MAATTRTRRRTLGLVVGLIVLTSGAIVVANASAVAVADSAGVEKQGISRSPGTMADDPEVSGFIEATEQIDPDTVLLGVALGPDGDAAWTVEYRVRLDDANTTDAFEVYRDDIEANTTEYTTRFADRLAPTVRTAENTTGREMTLRNVTVDVERRQLPQEYGIVTYQFAWANFSAVEGDRLAAGDALAGFFLDEETTMTVSWPDGYHLDTVDPAADATSDDSVTWDGTLNFDTDEPRLVVTTQPATTDATGNGNDGELVPWWRFGLVVVLVAVTAVAAYWYREHSEDSDDATTGGDSGGDDDNGGGDDGGVPPELLTDEERVVALLEEQGGRVKQQEIAATFEWTDAKTSQVVTRLRENDDVDVLRIGRENVVSLPDEPDI